MTFLNLKQDPTDKEAQPGGFRAPAEYPVKFKRTKENGINRLL